MKHHKSFPGYSSNNNHFIKKRQEFLFPSPKKLEERGPLCIRGISESMRFATNCTIPFTTSVTSSTLCHCCCLVMILLLVQTFKHNFLSRLYYLLLKVSYTPNLNFLNLKQTEVTPAVVRFVLIGACQSRCNLPIDPSPTKKSKFIIHLKKGSSWNSILLCVSIVSRNRQLSRDNHNIFPDNGHQ